MAILTRRAPTREAGPQPAEPSGHAHTGRWLLLIMLLGFAVRLHYVIGGGGFPVHDGGLFYATVRDLQAHRYAVPQFASYNGGQIPFVYPPLGLYTAGLMSDATRLPLLTVFAYLPAVINTLTITAVYLLTRSSSRQAARSSSSLPLNACARCAPCLQQPRWRSCSSRHG